MMFRQFLKSETGGKVLTGLAAVSCASGICAYLIPQGLLLEKSVKVFQTHKFGSPAPLRKSLQLKGAEVLEKTNLNPGKKNLVKFFNVYGYEIYHLGSTTTPYGAYIGIPTNFAYKSKFDIDLNSIMLRYCSDIPWDTAPGEDLLSSLILSDSAQKFAIARDIYAASYPLLYIRGIGTSTLMLFVVWFSRWGNRRFQLLDRTFKARAFWYTLTGFLGFSLWTCLKDISTVFLDKKCDKLASDLGLEYTNGGVEYYEKIMLMNRSIRTLMGDKGDDFYTLHGNKQSFIRMKTVPLSQRLDTLIQRQKKWQTEVLTH